MTDTLSLIMTGVGALLAGAALGTGRGRQREALYLLISACALGTIGLLVGGQRPLSACSSNLSIMLAVTGLGAALWGLILFRQDKKGTIVSAILLTISLAVRTVWPALTYTGLCPPSAPFQMAAISMALAVGALLLGSASALIGTPQKGGRAVESSLALALALQASALVLQGLGAQWAWGSYWRWDPIECWHLVACLATATALLGIRALNWQERGARWALYAATLLAAAVSFALPPLAAWLGLSSLYIMG